MSLADRQDCHTNAQSNLANHCVWRLAGAKTAAVQCTLISYKGWPSVDVTSVGNVGGVLDQNSAVH